MGGMGEWVGGKDGGEWYVMGDGGIEWYCAKDARDSALSGGGMCFVDVGQGSCTVIGDGAGC